MLRKRKINQKIKYKRIFRSCNFCILIASSSTFFSKKGWTETCRVGSVVEWLKHRTDDQHGLSSKPTCAILLCPWERHFTALSPAW